MKILISTTVALLLSLFSFAQEKIEKSFDYKNFDKVYLQGQNADAQISIGKNWSIRVEGPEESVNNLEMTYSSTEYKLEIKNKPGKVGYKKNQKPTTIYITMPEASVIAQSGNGDLAVKGIVGKYFRLEQEGNGDCTLSGSIDSFDLEKGGNGDLNAGSLKVAAMKFTTAGNGDTTVNVSEKMSGKLVGNGDLINRGAARCNDCKKNGNGDFIYR
ncbi:DUF2807 domain-containing protein [Flavobacterium sp.]|uniref:GIN domain-containing protein n=1 Tax=Flavobacterium sp. TaxID=239 RepID=UPI00260C7FCF|nr:DUF2807 domain-containing protein [Flavobacterium sp.]